MTRARKPSQQAALVLASFAAKPSTWRHGYDLSRETGLASGTLYPLLVRLNGAGLLEAEWKTASQPGRPPRHAYRLTAKGLALTREAMASEGLGVARRLVGAAI